MATREFKVGDLVRVYDVDGLIIGEVTQVFDGGTKLDVYFIQDGAEMNLVYWAKQCRRLKPRKKSVRVTKAALHNAVKNARIGLGRTDMAVEYSPVIEEVCRILGLDEESGK